MKKISSAILLSTGILFSTASIAGISDIAQCNDCSSMASQQAASELQRESVFIVDFVNRTAQKYSVENISVENNSVENKGAIQLTSMTVSELNHINQKYDYRKVHLRAVKP